MHTSRLARPTDMRRDAKKVRQVSAGSLTAADTVAEARFWVAEMLPLHFQHRPFVSFQVRDSTFLALQQFQPISSIVSCPASCLTSNLDNTVSFITPLKVGDDTITLPGKLATAPVVALLTSYFSQIFTNWFLSDEALGY